MTAKIDEKTVVPLSWLLVGFAFGLAPVMAATFWVAGVNNRLQRIEQKLGIPEIKEATLLEEKIRS